MLEHTQETVRQSHKKLVAVLVMVVALLTVGVGTSVALAATPAHHSGSSGVATSALNPLEGIAGIFNATTCGQVVTSTAYTVSLVASGNSDAPYCEVTLKNSFAAEPVVTANSYGGGNTSIVLQGANYPAIDFQVWTSGSNVTGQEGAGFVMFTVAKPTK
jgi:hypothetical protein